MIHLHRLSVKNSCVNLFVAWKILNIIILALEVFLVSVKLLKQMDDFKNCHLNQI